MIKVGDLVIKSTGGNKMRVITITNGIAECIWITDKLNSDHFDIKDLREFCEYKSLFINHYRQEKIDRLLGI